MDHSAELDEISEALALAQAKVEQPRLNSTGGPPIRNKYADLGEVLRVLHPVLDEYDLAVVQLPGPIENGAATLYTMITHRSGQWIGFKGAIPVQKGDPQGFGSGFSYLRRYALNGAFRLHADEDDDGGAASQRQAPQQRSSGAKQPKPSKATPEDPMLAPVTLDTAAKVGALLNDKRIPKKLRTDAKTYWEGKGEGATEGNGQSVIKSLSKYVPEGDEQDRGDDEQE